MNDKPRGDEGVNWNLCPQGVKHDTEITEMKRRMDSYEKSIGMLIAELRDIRDNLLKRPSWMVSIFITVLTGTLGSCIMFILTRK